MSKYKSGPLLLAAYRMLNAFLLAVSMVGTLGSYLGIWQTKASHVIVAAILTALFAWCSYGKSNEKIICVIAVIGILFVGIPMISGSQVVEFPGAYLKWLTGAAGYNEAWILSYELVQVAWVALVCYLISVLAEKAVWLKTLSGLSVVFLLIWDLILGMQVQKFFVAAAVVYVLIVCTELLQTYWQKQKSGDTREYLLFLTPFLALYMVLMLLMPYSEHPYDWKLFKDIYSNVSEKITVLVESLIQNGAEDFGGSIAGFSEDGKLAIRIAGRSQDLMIVEGDRNLYTNVYLTGKIYDTFDGREWTKQIQDAFDPVMDTLELAYGVSNYDSELMSNYFRRTILKVQYKRFHTRYVFAPAKWSVVSAKHKQVKDEEILFDKKVGYGTKYDVTYYQMNLNAKCFGDMLRTRPEENPDNWDYVRYQYGNTEWQHYTLEDLSKYRDGVKEEYGKPIILTESVTALLDELFAECDTDYDRMKALERYLSAMEYTASPGKLPDWVESQETFAEYFFTEGKRGYCSYFATAFVLVARAQGLPARYVEGFCVPVSQDKAMVATTDMTHAWPEVYFEGVGWIPFEPTPGYGAMRYSGWKLKKPKQESQIDYSQMESNPYENWVEEPSQPTEPVEVKKSVNWKAILWWVISVSGLVILCAVVLLAERALQKHRYARLSPEQQFEKKVRRLMWIWARLGYRRAGEETLQELKDRISSDWWEAPLPLKKPKIWRQARFLAVYQDYLYGNLQVTKEHAESILLEEEELMEYLKDNRKWLYILAWLRM